jgi:hypothetical protein
VRGLALVTTQGNMFLAGGTASAKALRPE